MSFTLENRGKIGKKKKREKENLSMHAYSFLTDADLNIAQTAWGDSGVYLCSVASDQDLTGNGECYTELIVLGKYPCFL